MHTAHLLLLLLAMAVSSVQSSPFSATLNSSNKWLLRSTGFYHMNTDRKTWKQAWQYCIKEGGHLVIIDTKEEVAVVKELMKTHSMHVVHAGLHDLFTEGEFVTIFGAPLSSTAHAWEANEPNNKGGAEHCAIFTGDGKTNDIPCDGKVEQIICEGVHFL